MSQESNITKFQITLTEVGVIISLLTSAGVGIFSLGVVYGQVQRNTTSIEKLEPKVDTLEKRIERIDANVGFLADLAREERAQK